MSSAEAFVRIQRLLASKRIVLVFCGMETGSRGGLNVKTALENVGLFEMDCVELFETANDAMECTFSPSVLTWYYWLAELGGRIYRDGERIPSGVVPL